MHACDAKVAEGAEGSSIRAGNEAAAAAADLVCKVLTKKGRMLEKKALKGPKTERCDTLRHIRALKACRCHLKAHTLSYTLRPYGLTP